MSDSSLPYGLQPTGSSVHGILQQVGCHALLQEIFLTQGSHPCLNRQVCSLHQYCMDRGTWEEAAVYRNESSQTGLKPLSIHALPRKPYKSLCAVLSRSVVSNSLRPHGLQPTVSSVHGILHGQEWAHEYWSGLPYPSSGYLPDPGIKPRAPTLQADSLLSESSGKSIKVYTRV